MTVRHAPLTSARDSSPTKTPSIRRTASRVLVVDDEPAACKLLSVFLSEAAFEFNTAISGEAALEVLGREQIDAVISDLKMPGISGMELLAEVRRLYPRLAFLVATGVDDIRVGIQAMKLGADDYLVKPFQEELVIASLRRALRQKQLEAEVQHYRQHLEEMVAERTQQLRAALEQVETSYEHTLAALGAALDLRDGETAGHSLRVCRYSLEIAGAMGLSDSELRGLAMGAYLHDIGKLATPDGILRKPGPLTPEEWKLMQQHVQTGYDLVKQIPFLAAAAEIILNHHERIDGSGYPRGLKAEQIPLAARIFAVADSLDAMTSDRPYRRAMPFEAAREEIRRKSGCLFDPQVAETFLQIPLNTWIAITKQPVQMGSLPSGLKRKQALPLPVPEPSPITSAR
jgi:putative nucleotidyltransferase with HDIG domain